MFLTKQYDRETMECTMGEYVQSFDLLKQRASERELGDVPYLRSWEIAQVHCAVVLVRVSLVSQRAFLLLLTRSTRISSIQFTRSTRR